MKRAAYRLSGIGWIFFAGFNVWLFGDHLKLFTTERAAIIVAIISVVVYIIAIVFIGRYIRRKNKNNYP